MLPNAAAVAREGINCLKKHSKVTEIKIFLGHAARHTGAPRRHQPIVGIVNSAPPVESVGHRTVTVFLRV